MLPTCHGNPRKSVSDGISLPPTWHGFSAKACQVAPLAAHLLRNPRESVPGVPSRFPPGTESPQKRSRCLIPLSTCHGIPAKACQVAPLAAHLARFSRKSVPGGISPPPTWHGIPAKAFQVAFPASHLPRNSRKSVSGSTSYRPPATVSLRKCSRWHLSASHLPRYPR